MTSQTSPNIVGAFIMPHGGIALDPNYFHTTDEKAKTLAWELNKACIEAGKMIQELNPERIFLSTPHGIADMNRFAMILNSSGSGDATTDNMPPGVYSVSANIDKENSTKIVQDLSEDFEVTGLGGFGGETFPLRWGEVIPLHFVPTLQSMEVMVMSQPLRRYTQEVEMIPELQKLGSSLYHRLCKIPKRTVVIISGDLAHTHSKDGPYGYSDTAEPFDRACGDWVTSLSSSALLDTAAGYVDTALSCGFTGFVMLDGLLSISGKDTWLSKLHVNNHPSYYGMMVASFIKK